MTADRWPATTELRALLDALLDRAPSGAERAALGRALALLVSHELVPRVLAEDTAGAQSHPTERRP